jgi:hypothetical protein
MKLIKEYNITMNTLLEPRIHTATNLYAYVKNVCQVENLKLQIRHKEQDLKDLEQLQEIYSRLGCINMCEVAKDRAGSIMTDIFLLMLDKNILEEQLREFEKAVCLED